MEVLERLKKVVGEAVRRGVTAQESEPGLEGPIYLDDAALSSVEEDRLGHRAYVETLKKSVQLCPTPFAIGLFGRWGVGKSTIGETLKLEIDKDEELRERFVTILFDVWRYPGDALKRKFLLTVEKELTGEETLGADLYKSRQEVTGVTYRFDWRLFWRYMLLFGVYLAVAGTLVLGMRKDLEAKDLFISALMSTAFFFLSFFQAWARDVETTETKTATEPPPASPEQFEKAFCSLLKEGGIGPSPGDKRLVVIMDNVDRCSAEYAVAALRDIKTFFDQPGCIYVVPCDDGAVVKHLSSSPGVRGEDDAREYLRKFFQLTVRILPKKRDLLDMAEEEVVKSAMEFPREVASVIWAAYPDNPRRIKLAINDLTAMCLFIQERTASGDLKGEKLLGNLPFLTKAIILEAEAPEFVAQVRNDYEVLRMFNEVLDDRTLLEGEDADTYKAVSAYFKGKGETQYKWLREFLRATRMYSDPDPRAFFELKETEGEILVPDFAVLQDRVRRGDSGYVVRVLEEKKEGRQREAYMVAVAEIIDNEGQAGRDLSTFNSVNVALGVYGMVPEELRSELARAITGAVIRVGLISRVWDLPVVNLMTILNDAPRRDSKRLLQGLATGLDRGAPNVVDQFFDGLPTVDSLLETEHFDAVGSFLEKLRAAGEWVRAAGLAQRLRDSDRVRHGLFSRPDGFVGNMVEGITPANPSGSEPYAEFLMSVVDVAHASNRERFVRKLTAMLTHHPEPGWHPTRDFGVKYLERLQVNFIPASTVPDVTAALRRAIELVPGPPERLRLLGILLRLYKALPEAEREQVNGQIPAWVDQFPKDQVVALSSLLRALEDSELVRAAVARGFATRLTRAEPPEVKEALIVAMADLDPTPRREIFVGGLGTLLDGSLDDCNVGAKVLVERFDAIPREEQQEVLRGLQRRAAGAPTDKVSLLVEAHARLAGEAEEVVLEGFADLLVELMESDEAGKRDCGVKAYAQIRDLLDNTKRRMVAYRLIKFMEGRVAQIDHTYRPLLEEVVASGDILTATQRSDLVQVLRNLLPATREIDQRKIGADCLGRVKPFPKRQRKDTLEDLKQFIEDKDTPEELLEPLKAAYEAIHGR